MFRKIKKKFSKNFVNLPNIRVVCLSLYEFPIISSSRLGRHGQIRTTLQVFSNQGLMYARADGVLFALGSATIGRLADLNTKIYTYV